MARVRRQKPQRPPQPEWSVDPLSDLVSAQELAIWRRDSTTGKVMRYLSRFRSQLLEHMGDGGTTAATAEATAILTAEAVTQAQLIKEILTLEAKDLAVFYGLEEPAEKGATH